MEHPALYACVKALRASGTKFQDEHAYRECAHCKKLRRWKIEEILHRRLMNFLLCNDCLARLELATTNRSESIVT